MSIIQDDLKSTICCAHSSTHSFWCINIMSFREFRVTMLFVAASHRDQPSGANRSWCIGDWQLDNFSILRLYGEGQWRSRMQMLVSHRQSMASVQLPQPTRSQAGNQRSLSFNPNPTWWDYRGNPSIAQPRDTLSRGSYQPIVLASLWSRLWSPAAHLSNFNF